MLPPVAVIVVEEPEHKGLTPTVFDIVGMALTVIACASVLTQPLASVPVTV